jgi:hypothetical protein
MERFISVIIIISTISSFGFTTQQTGAFSCDQIPIPERECEALVALYSNTNGAEWNDHTGWLESTSPDEWYGVEVFDGHVTRLELAHNNLVGTIPLELGDLSYLDFLALSFNQLSGAIPREIGALSNLRSIGMGENPLEGAIPPELGKLSNLTSLYIFHTNLTGPIPPELGDLSNLDGLALHQNKLTGSIPTELGKLTNLVQLFLSENQLEGTIPTELGNLSKLTNLTLYDNQLTGLIPSELGQLINLTQLMLNNNQLNGDVPASFINLTNLCVPGMPECDSYGLDLSYNYLDVPAPEPPTSFLAIKDPDWYLTQGIVEIVEGETGVIITSNDETTEIVIPPEAVEGEVTITFTPLLIPNNETGSLIFAETCFEFSVEQSGEPIISFQEPVMLTIYYDESLLGSIPEHSLRLYYWDSTGSAWVDAVTTCTGGAYTRDLEANFFTVPICHLSEFAVLGQQFFQIHLPLIGK